MDDLFDDRDHQAEKYRKRIKALCRRTEKQKERISELEAEISYSNEAYKRTIMEQCGDDEYHCACVPHLKRRIADLEAALKDCLNYIDIDNLTMQHRERAWKTVLAGGKWRAGNVEAT